MGELESHMAVVMYMWNTGVAIKGALCLSFARTRIEAGLDFLSGKVEAEHRVEGLLYYPNHN